MQQSYNVRTLSHVQLRQALRELSIQLKLTHKPIAAQVVEEARRRLGTSRAPAPQVKP